MTPARSHHAPSLKLAAALCRKVFQQRGVKLFTRYDRQYIARGIGPDRKDWIAVRGADRSWSAA